MHSIFFTFYKQNAETNSLFEYRYKNLKVHLEAAKAAGEHRESAR